MPTYSFKCPKCTLRFEKSMKINDEHVCKCPDCNTFSNKMPPTGVGMNLKESTHIPKEIDLLVGADADKRRKEYEERAVKKEKLRKETGSHFISRTAEGEYVPVLGGGTKEEEKEKTVDKELAATIRKNATDQYREIKNDPESTKFTPKEE